MRLFKTFLVWVFLAISVFCVPEAVIAADGSKVEQLNKLMDYCGRNDLFSGAVLVAEKGNEIYRNSFGSANREWNIPNSIDTKFRIGSISKIFTSILVMQLADQMKLSLDDHIIKYLKYYRRETGEKVTIYHLLTHTSGISDFKGIKKPESYNDKKFYKLEDYVKEFCTGDLEFEPGSKFIYSNKGFIILGAIIESVTGKKYEENLRINILAPLGMKNTGFDTAAKILPKRATGYVLNWDGYTNASYIDTSSVHGAGAVYSTVDDMFLLDRSLYTQRLLPDELLEKMFSPFRGPYGCGWWIMKDYIGHGGEISGFQSRFQRFTGRNNTIIILSNNQLQNLKPLSVAIEAILNGNQWEKPKRSFAHVVSDLVLSETGDQSIVRLNDFLMKKGGEVYIDPMEFYELGDFLLKKGELNKARKIAEFNNEKHPDKWFIFYQLGNVDKLSGNKAAAILNYNKALNLYPHKGKRWYLKISNEIKNLTEKNREGI